MVLRLALVGQHADPGCTVWIDDCDLLTFRHLFPVRPLLEVAGFLGTDGNVDLTVGLWVASLEIILRSPREDPYLEVREAREMVLHKYVLRELITHGIRCYGQLRCLGYLIRCRGW